VLDGGVKAATAAVLIAAVLAGCGGRSARQTASTPAPTPSNPAPATSNPQSANSAPAPQAHAPKHRTKPQPLTNPSSAQPLKVGGAYTCKGQRLKAISTAGPVKVQPKVVKPGQSFSVTITDPSAKVALVSLAGVAPKPIQVPAKEQNGKLAATLNMPGYATCGNKLLEIEGDLSAEAYVGVSG
jgi:hypothetical protein